LFADVLTRSGRRISTLEMSSTSGISASDLANIGRSCPFLETMILRNCSFDQQDDLSIDCSGVIFPHLKTLYFSTSVYNCYKASAVLSFVVNSASILEELYIEDCLDVSDDLFIQAFNCDGLQLLRTVQISSCGRFKLFTKLSFLTVLTLVTIL
jgi:hypothetical protein